MFTRGKILEHWQEVVTLQKVFQNTLSCNYIMIFFTIQLIVYIRLYCPLYSRHIFNDGTHSRICWSLRCLAGKNRKSGKGNILVLFSIQLCYDFLYGKIGKLIDIIFSFILLKRWYRWQKQKCKRLPTE